MSHTRAVWLFVLALTALRFSMFGAADHGAEETSLTYAFATSEKAYMIRFKDGRWAPQPGLVSAHE